MAMSKGQTLACGAGGVFLVAAGVLGWFLFDAWSTRTEAEESLEEEMAVFRRFNQAAVFPSVKAIAGVNSNKAAYAAWTSSAREFAARGDKAFALDEAPSAFKQRLANEVRRIGALPGGVGGRLAANGFFFGFDKYLGESAVLPEAADVPRLTVQLDTIVRFAERFAKAGVLEMKEVVRVAPAVPEAEEDEKPRKNRRNAKKSKAAEAETDKTSSLDYKFTFLVRPSGFVEALNALTADARFVVVKDLAFRSSADTIVDKLNADEAARTKKDEASGSRRRRRRAAAEEAEEEAPKGDNRLVVDPELDAPVAVNVTVTVYDFGRAAGEKAAAEEAAPADERKEAKQ